VSARTGLSIAARGFGIPPATWPRVDPTISTIGKIVMITAALPFVLASLLYLFA
jgi:hypothetical protein